MQIDDAPHKSIRFNGASRQGAVSPAFTGEVYALAHRNNHVTIHEYPTNKRRRKFFFGFPALIFLSLAAIEPIEIRSVAATLASLRSAQLAAQGEAVIDTPIHCIDRSGDGTRKLRQIDI
jgi:hypothetical protein